MATDRRCAFGCADGLGRTYIQDGIVECIFQRVEHQIMPRDYQQTLRTMTHKANIYIAKHRLALNKYMTPEQVEALNAFEQASKRLQEALGPTPYNIKNI